MPSVVRPRHATGKWSHPAETRPPFTLFSSPRYSTPMWLIYRKRFLIMQIPILAVCAILRFAYESPWPRVGLFYAIMQIPGVIGAWWTSRLTGK